MEVACFHCGEPVPAGSEFSVEIDNQLQPMCCPGCQAVAETIVESGLLDYYRHRTEKAQQAVNGLIPDALYRQWQDLDELTGEQQFYESDGEQISALLTVEGVKCAACAWLIEKTLASEPGVIRYHVNVTTQRLVLAWNQQETRLSKILEKLAKVGYVASPFDQSQEEQRFKATRQSMLIRLGISGLATMQVMMFAIALYFGVLDMEPQHEHYLRWVSLIMATPVIGYAALPFYQNALKGLRAGYLNMDVPVSIALLLAYSASLWATLFYQGEVFFESVSMFTFLLLVGRYLELMARYKATAHSSNLMTLLPAVVQRETAQGVEPVTLAALQVGDIIHWRPGDSLPIDGVVISGKSSIDMAVLTGEQDPLPAQSGTAVYAGSINQVSPLKVRVEKIKDTLVTSIIHMQEKALGDKPEVAQLADSVARYFVSAILLIAGFTYLYWAKQGDGEAFWIALSVLVATCPCALSLATPTALTIGLSRLSQIGIIPKRGRILELLSQIDTIVFDKTGTLTEGELAVSELKHFSDLTEEQIYQLTTALETASEHPIAKALSQQQLPRLSTEGIRNYPGAGVEGQIEGAVYRLGNSQFIAAAEPFAKQYQVFLAQGDKLLAAFNFSDPLREGAETVTSSLQRRGITPHILSGDNSHRVSSVAEQLAITNWQASMLPEDKLEWVKQAQQHAKKILMVGDGINDMPVLAQADTSVAIGKGSDLAKHSADAVMISHDIQSLLSALDIGKATQKIIRQNLSWALGYNMVVLPLAVSGMVTPYIAVIGMSLSSLIVVMNALRLTSKE